MEVIHERCAGLDVHKETVVGCVRVSERGEVRHEVRRFATTTAGLLELADWLRQAGCTPRGNGSYWGLLEAGVGHPGGGVRADPGQPGTHPERAGAQKRRQRRDLDRRPAGARVDPREHGSARTDSGAARSDPYPQAVDARGGAAQAAHSEGALRTPM